MLSLLFAGLLSLTNAAEPDPNQPLLGVWTIVTAEANGQPQENWVGGSVVFTDDTYTLSVGGEPVEHGSFAATLTEMNIELRPATGGTAGQTELGIVSAEERYLVLCKAKPHNARPSLFDSTAENGHTLLVLKREADQYGNAPESLGNENE